MLAEVRVARCEAHPSSFQGIAHRCNHRRMSRENHRSRPRPQPHTCTSHVLTGGLWNSGARRAIASPSPAGVENMLANANLDKGPVGAPAPFAASARAGSVRSHHWTRPCRDSRLAHRPIGPSAHRPSSVLRRARPDARRVAPDQTTPVPGSRNMRARPAGRRAPWAHTRLANQDRSSEQPRSLTSIAVDSKDHDRLDDHGDVDTVVACRGLAARPGFASSVVRSRHRGNAGFLHPLFRFHS